MDANKVKIILQKTPAVHKLFYGAFIQETLRLKENIFAIPLKSLGFDTEANYTAKYVTEICGGNVDEGQLKTLQKQGENALPVIALVVQLMDDETPKELELKAEKTLSIPEKILGWSAGENLTPFAYITCTTEQSYFRVIPPLSRKRQRLGFGNTGDDYYSQLSRMIKCAENDEHFLFAISLYKDALSEDNEVFKIARYFSCLESLAYKIKSKELPSRKAVKSLLGLDDGAVMELNINGAKYRFDRIEIAGRLRDKLFHGVPFTKKDLNVESKPIFELLESNPEKISKSLRDDCELEFARWSNGASKGLKT